jgi:hypothetical protein
MAQIAQFSVPGGVVYVEAADKLRAGGEERAAAIETIGKYLRGGGDADSPAPDLSERVSPIIAALKVVQEKLVAVGNPNTVELEAGIKFTGEAGVILSKYGAEASISIKLTWHRQEKTPSQNPS